MEGDRRGEEKYSASEKTKVNKADDLFKGLQGDF